jgi:hypothetical protein
MSYTHFQDYVLLSLHHILNDYVNYGRKAKANSRVGKVAHHERPPMAAVAAAAPAKTPTAALLLEACGNCYLGPFEVFTGGLTDGRTVPIRRELREASAILGRSALGESLEICEKADA